MPKILRTTSTAAILLSLAACGGGSAGDAGPAPIPAPPVQPIPDNGGGNGGGTGGGNGAVPPPAPITSAEYDRSAYAKAAKALSAYDKGITGAGVTLAILDTGIDVDNPEFAGRISSASKSFASNYVACSSCETETAHFSLNDVQGHGTLVASVAAAAKNNRATHGVAYDATIMALKIAAPKLTKLPEDRRLIEESGVELASIPAAINHAVANNAFVINLSANGAADPLLTAQLKAAMDNVRTNDRLFVQSVSNYSGDSYARSFTESLIGADRENQDWFLYGIRLDADLKPITGNGRPGAMAHRTLAVVAHGIWATNINEQEVTTSGNSFAAPAIAGAAALLKQYWPQLGGKEISQILLSTATDLGVSGVDQQYGAGLLNIEAALQADAPQIGPTSRNLSAIAQSGLLISPAFGGAATSAAFGAAAGNAVAIDTWGRDYAVPVGAMVAGLNAGGISLASLVQKAPLPHATLVAYPAYMGDYHHLAMANMTHSSPAAQFAFRLDAKRAISGAFNSAIDSSELITGSLLRAGNIATMGTHINLFSHGKRFTMGLANMGDGLHRSQTQRFEMQMENGLIMGLTRNEERGSALGMRGSGAFQIDGARSDFINLGWQGALGSLQMAGEAMAGRTKVATRGSMVDFDKAVLSSGFRLKGEHPAWGGMALLGITSPIKVERAQIVYTAPTAYDLESRSTISESRHINLAPTAREVTVEMGWSKMLGGAGQRHLSVNGAYGFHSGHIKSNSAAAAWLRYSNIF